MEPQKLIWLEFSISDIKTAMGDFLTLVQTQQNLFTNYFGLQTNDLSIDSISFLSGSNDIGESDSGGTVNFRIDFTLFEPDQSLRRLIETDSSFDKAVVDSVKTLVGPSLPKESHLECSSTVDGSRISASVSVHVPSNVMKTQKDLTEFLSQDSRDANALPSLVSERTGLAVAYTEGYVPVVWSELDVAVQVVIILPYVLAGVGVITLILAVILYKYRFVIRSFLSELVSKLIPSKSRWGTSTFGATFLTVTSLLNRGKSEISSTPDTATNVDEDEFDDYIMRNSA